MIALSRRPDYAGEDQVAKTMKSTRKGYTKDDVKLLKTHPRPAPPSPNSLS